MIKTLKILRNTLIIFLVVLVVLVIYLTSFRTNGIRKQNKHLKNITKEYETYEEKGSLEYSSLDYSDVPFNKVGFLASHNSYKTVNPSIGRFFVGIFDSFKEANAMKYTNKTVTEQLQNGIFSFELDLRYRKNEFEVTHVPLVDNTSTIVNFKKGLKEINMFLEHEPNSFPLTIILEIKDDYMFLDPFLKNIKDKELLQLENDIIEILGSKVYTPNDLLNGKNTIKEELDENGWPTISKLEGKVMFVLHAGKYATNYQKIKPLSEQILFTSSYDKEANSPFIIHNDLDVDKINDFVDDGYIVRTRIGSTTNYKEEDLAKAIESRAQILTSDFSIARKDNKLPVLYFKFEKTIYVY